MYDSKRKVETVIGNKVIAAEDQSIFFYVFFKVNYVLF